MKIMQEDFNHMEFWSV